MNKNKKSNVISGEEHYTNLMLIVVAEAMVLLITQLLIYNGFKSIYHHDLTMKIVVPVITGIAAIVAIVSAIVYFMKKKNALISLVFGGYITLLTLVIKYLPSFYSEAWGKYMPSYERNQKIGIILSVIYVIAGILYCILAEKRRRKLEK